MPSFYFKDIPFDGPTARNVPLDLEEELTTVMFLKCLPVEVVWVVRIAGVTVMLVGLKADHDRFLVTEEKRPRATQRLFNDDVPLVSDKELTLHKNAGSVVVMMPFHAP